MRSAPIYAVYSFIVCCVLALTLTLTGSAPHATAASPFAVQLPPGFSQTQVGNSFNDGTAMAFAPDGRLFVAQQSGALRIIKDGTLLATPFLSITVDSNGERGLLGVTFDPSFASNHFVYVYHTVPGSPPHNQVSRYTANGDVAQAGSEQVILDLNNLSGATNHNGGAMHFGPDGKLYVAAGENANPSNAQTLNNLLGKVLRINKDGTIPTDNPFYGTATGQNRAIWAMGLRNPYTFDFQPGTGRLHINDVGQSTWEEINLGAAGANYGWPQTEGPTTQSGVTAPIYAYQHGSGTPTGCAITGGTFYNPATSLFPSSYTGKYFFADYCGSWIYSIDPSSPATATQFATSTSNAPVDLKVGPDGALYYLSRSSGGSPGIYRIGYADTTPPQVVNQPANVRVAVGQKATFSVAATGSTPLRYQWQRNGTDISGATEATYSLPSAVAGDSGAKFRCVVTNSFGSDTSAEATLTVIGGKPPTATITEPKQGTTWKNGDTVSFAATATDPDDGTLPASAYHWVITLQHADHQHPLATYDGVKDGTTILNTTGHAEPNIWYRFSLTVTDSSGLSYTTYRDIQPRKITLSLATYPAGLALTLDGQPVRSPNRVAAVVGIPRSIGAATQTVHGKQWQFFKWSDGGAATHDISIPATNTTYTAVFVPVNYVGLQLRSPTDTHIGVGAGSAFDATLTVINNTGAILPKGTPVTFSFSGLHFAAGAVKKDAGSIAGATWQSLSTGKGVAVLATDVATGQRATITLHIALTSTARDVGKQVHVRASLKAGQRYASNSLDPTFADQPSGTGSNGASRTLDTRKGGSGNTRTLAVKGSFFGQGEPIVVSLSPTSAASQPVRSFADSGGRFAWLLRGLAPDSYSVTFTGLWSGISGQTTVTLP